MEAKFEVREEKSTAGTGKLPFYCRGTETPFRWLGGRSLVRLRAGIRVDFAVVSEALPIPSKRTPLFGRIGPLVVPFLPIK